MNITFQISTPALADELGLDRDATAGWIGSNYDAFVAACLDGGLAAIKTVGLPAAPPPIVEATEESEAAPASTSDADPVTPSDSPPAS